MPNRLTTADVARELGITSRLVRRLAHTLGVGSMHGRDWIFTDADMAVLRARNRVRGRPPTT